MSILDAIDVKILGLLQENARRAASEIGAMVGMSVSAVIERIRKLESSGIIEQYTTILSNERLNRGLIGFVHVCLESQQHMNEFVETVVKLPEVLEVHFLAGDFDYLVKVITASTSTLDTLLRRIKSIQGVSRTYTAIVLATQKNEHSIRADLNEGDLI